MALEADPHFVLAAPRADRGQRLRAVERVRADAVEVRRALLRVDLKATAIRRGRGELLFVQRGHCFFEALSLELRPIDGVVPDESYSSSLPRVVTSTAALS